MYELALFAGAGGGILGGKLCGFTCVGAVEIEEYPREVLKQRQRDGLLPQFPIWDDIKTFSFDNPKCRPFCNVLSTIRRELIITGGFPCQDISSAGEGEGIAEDTRSGLWFEMARIIREFRPAEVFVENSPILTSRGLGIVLRDLAQMGYNARWGVLGASDVGAYHKRERIWIFGSNTMFIGSQGRDGKGKKGHRKVEVRPISSLVQSSSWPDVSDPHAYGSNNGLAHRVDRTKAIGNGQVPAVAHAAYRILKQEQ